MLPPVETIRHVDNSYLITRFFPPAGAHNPILRQQHNRPVYRGAVRAARAACQRRRDVHGGHAARRGRQVGQPALPRDKDRVE